MLQLSSDLKLKSAKRMQTNTDSISAAVTGTGGGGAQLAAPIMNIWLIT